MTENQLPKPHLNQVLIEVTNFNDRIKLKSGGELYLANTFEQFKNSPTEGVVAALPNELRASKRPGFMRYETTMDIAVGDIVIFHYLCYFNAAIGENGMTDGKMMEIDGRVYLLVKYESIYLAKRKSDTPYLVASHMNERELTINQLVLDEEDKVAYNIIVLNGYIIFEGIDDVLSSKYIIIPEQSKRHLKQGIVKFIGSKIIRHLIPEMPGDEDDIAVGDVICLPKSGDIPLQYDLHRSFEKKYYRVLRSDILAITGNVIQNVQEQTTPETNATY